MKKKFLFKSIKKNGFSLVRFSNRLHLFFNTSIYDCNLAHAFLETEVEQAYT